ncbi:MAG: hypothetical protein AAFY84_12745 [Pseudomonadota bacterium]
MTYKERAQTPILAHILRGIGNLVRQWKLVVPIAFLASPVGPHVLWEYDYSGRWADGAPMTSRCSYYGSRGRIEVYQSRCPYLAWFDARAF